MENFPADRPAVLRIVGFRGRFGMDLDRQTREFLQAIRSHIAGLPEGERLNALLKFVSVMLDYLTREQVLCIRAEMVATYGEQNLTEALNLLDGHLALRELEDQSEEGLRE